MPAGQHQVFIAALQVQGRVLSSRFGVSTDIASLLRQMWLSHIPSTGILEPKPQTTLRRRGSGAAEDAQAADDEDGDGGGEQQAGKGLADMRAANLAEPYNMKRLFWKVGGWLLLLLHCVPYPVS